MVETYEFTGKHTFLPMAIFASCLGVVLLFLIVLYRKLAPQSSLQQKSSYIDATLPFKAKYIEEIGEKKKMSNRSCTFCFKTAMYCLAYISIMMHEVQKETHSAIA